ncbi:MAG: hypothetical protein IJ257_09035 [Treponema sp.]|nr:hypothetical protein [Treponema sp.]
MKKEGIVAGSPFITYQRKGCQIHTDSFDTYDEACQYAKSTGLVAKNCSKCLDGQML